MRGARGTDFDANVPDLEHIEGARGATLGGIPIHAVRLPGFVASQEVIFGGLGQTLTLRHDTTGREAFMPGVIIAIRETRKGPYYTLRTTGHPRGEVSVRASQVR
jgi:4-hydroxy-tetrahydrodipicolinate reductase